MTHPALKEAASPRKRMCPQHRNRPLHRLDFLNTPGQPLKQCPPPQVRERTWGGGQCRSEHEVPRREMMTSH